MFIFLSFQLYRPAVVRQGRHCAVSITTGGTTTRESNGLRYRSDRLDVSQNPRLVAIAKVPVERLVARGRCESFAFVRTIEIER
jgi:hypothetical protein